MFSDDGSSQNVRYQADASAHINRQHDWMLIALRTPGAKANPRPVGGTQPRRAGGRIDQGSKKCTGTRQHSPFNTGTFQVAPSTTRDVLRHQLHSGILIIVAVIRDWRKPR